MKNEYPKGTKFYHNGDLCEVHCFHRPYRRYAALDNLDCTFEIKHEDITPLGTHVGGGFCIGDLVEHSEHSGYFKQSTIIGHNDHEILLDKGNLLKETGIPCLTLIRPFSRHYRVHSLWPKIDAHGYALRAKMGLERERGCWRIEGEEVESKAKVGDMVMSLVDYRHIKKGSLYKVECDYKSGAIEVSGEAILFPYEYEFADEIEAEQQKIRAAEAAESIMKMAHDKLEQGKGIQGLFPPEQPSSILYKAVEHCAKCGSTTGCMCPRIE